MKQSKLIYRFFSQTKIQKNIQNSLNMIKRKKRVIDVKDNQNNIKQNLQNNLLQNKIIKTSRMDKDFKEFIKKFEQKQNCKIIDATSLNPDSILSESNRKLSEREHELLEDFKERQELNKKLDLEEKLYKYTPDINLEWRGLEDFQYIIMDTRVTSNTTTLKRITKFSSFVYGGNTAGIVGYGKGTGNDLEQAFSRARFDLHRNLISLNLDVLNTFPKSIRAKFNRTEITMWTRGTFNSWGNYLFAHMIQMAGIHHCSFRVVQRNPNPRALVFCFMKLFTQNLTPKQLAEDHGVKLYDTVWMKDTRMKSDPYDFI